MAEQRDVEARQHALGAHEEHEHPHADHAPAHDEYHDGPIRRSMPHRKETWVQTWNRLLEFMFRSDVEYSEFQSCVMALTWGVWLAFNPDWSGPSFIDLTVTDALRTTFASLRTLLPVWVWSAWFIALGTGHFFALVLKRWTARRCFSFLAFLTWLFVCVFLALSNVHLVTVPTTGFFAIGAVWGYWRLARTHGIEAKVYQP